MFTIKYEEDVFLDNAYNKIISELKEFYEFNWDKNTPQVFYVPNRKTYDKIFTEKTEVWQVGRSQGKNVFVLAKDNYETESCHKYDEEKYFALIKHELSHSFFDLLTKGKFPIWINEGCAIYSSGQNKWKKSITKFGNITSIITYEDFMKNLKIIYAESGFAVELLIEKFGINDFRKLVKHNFKSKDNKTFDELFVELYNIKPDYNEFNKLLKKE